MPDLPAFGRKAGETVKSKKKTFQANYRTFCETCRYWIDEGDWVGYNEADEVVHEECL